MNSSFITLRPDALPDSKTLYKHVCLNKWTQPACIKRILGECLLISSLPGKAFRTLVDIARLAERFNMRSQSRAW